MPGMQSTSHEYLNNYWVMHTQQKWVMDGWMFSVNVIVKMKEKKVVQKSAGKLLKALLEHGSYTLMWPILGQSYFVEFTEGNWILLKVQPKHWQWEPKLITSLLCNVIVAIYSDNDIFAQSWVQSRNCNVIMFRMYNLAHQPIVAQKLL